MSSNIVYPQGKKVEIAAAASDKIAVWSQGPFKVYQVVGYPNEPDRRTLLTEVASGLYTSSAFSAAATLEIEAGASEVLYQVGVDATITEIRGQRNQGTPGVLNATGALTAAMILSGIVTSTTAAGVAATVPTGTVMDAATEMAIGDSFDWSAINTGGNAFTVTAATGHTLVGAAATAAGTSGVYRTRKTAAATYVTYRIG